MKKTLFNRALAFTYALFLSSLVSRAQTTESKLYGITFFSNEIISINTSTGAGELVGPVGRVVAPYGLAAYSGFLYLFDANSDGLKRLDPQTGAAIEFYDIGLKKLEGEGDLAIRKDGIGFLFSALDEDGVPVNDLYSFDLAQSTSQHLGSTGVTLDGLAFDKDNVLYALGQGDGQLYILDQSTGKPTAVGNLGIAVNSPFAAIAFGPDDVLYAALNDRLYTVNKSTGAATEVNSDVLDFNFSSVSGLTFLDSSIPGNASDDPPFRINRDGNKAVVSWHGDGLTLESSDSLNGTWTKVSGDKGPYILTAKEKQRYFRLRRHEQ